MADSATVRATQSTLHISTQPPHTLFSCRVLEEGNLFPDKHGAHQPQESRHGRLRHGWCRASRAGFRISG
ncbi:hypothetical protein T484DRAFT_1939677 [Baffinella frigidus]|nr:hypothetical protein T484DRAFT_1939677 [Cryptophyta sp. CCMP2293]